MDISGIKHIYFIGIGGIGMSAIARYFNSMEYTVAGYDRTITRLTETLETEGMHIHYNDSIELVPDNFKDPSNTLIIYTPAIPKNHAELNWFKENKFIIKKRAEVLGLIIKDKAGVAVAGTHGKTTVSSMIATIFNKSEKGCSAFLGGITKNFKSNYLIDKSSNYVVVEADEFDRSFLHLYPENAVITAIDPDHLDIYEDKDDLVNTFHLFINQIQSGGKLIHKAGLPLDIKRLDIQAFTYHLTDQKADFHIHQIALCSNSQYLFSVSTPFGIIENLTVAQQGLVNVENSLAAIAVAMLNKIEPAVIREALNSFEGIWRRFDTQINKPGMVFIDDYAHHPEELKATILSVRDLYKGKKITGIFQPHLFTRTRDFADGFAESLSLLDEVILTDIYPAREEPIPGVSSEIIFNKINTKYKTLCEKPGIIAALEKNKHEVVLTLGAGDIDKEVENVKNYLLKQ